MSLDPQTIFTMLRWVQFAPDTFFWPDYTGVSEFLHGYRIALAHSDIRITTEQYMTACQDRGLIFSYPVPRLIWGDLMSIRPDLEMQAAFDLLIDIEIRAYEHALDVQEIRQYFE